MYLTRDGVTPAELIQVARGELLSYPSVTIVDSKVDTIRGNDGSFKLITQDGKEFSAQKIILATGLSDILPKIPGLAEVFGTAVFHCSICHGYEMQDQSLLVIGGGERDAIHALYLRDRHTSHVTLCTNGTLTMNSRSLDRLQSRDIDIYHDEIISIDGDLGHLNVELPSANLTQYAAFHAGDWVQGSTLPADLGCALSRDGRVVVDSLQATSVPGVLAAGDMAQDESRTDRMTFIALSVASGVRAAAVLDESLFMQNFADIK